MPWTRKPRVYKSELAAAVDKAFVEQRTLLIALGLISNWSARWKVAAKAYRAELGLRTRERNLFIEENEALISRVSDLEAEVAALHLDGNR